MNATATPAAPTVDEMKGRFLRIEDVMTIVGISRVQLYQWIKDGKFPKQIKLTEKYVMWPREVVKQWQDDVASGKLVLHK